VPSGGKASREKGKRFERAVARLFRDELGLDAWRGRQERTGESAPDVDVPGLWVECKSQRLTNPRAALAQAIADSKGSPDRIPIAVTKDDRQVPIVTMRLADFFRWSKRQGEFDDDVDGDVDDDWRPSIDA